MMKHDARANQHSEEKTDLGHAFSKYSRTWPDVHPACVQHEIPDLNMRGISAVCCPHASTFWFQIALRRKNFNMAAKGYDLYASCLSNLAYFNLFFAVYHMSQYKAAPRSRAAYWCSAHLICLLCLYQSQTQQRVQASTSRSAMTWEPIYLAILDASSKPNAETPSPTH